MLLRPTYVLIHILKNILLQTQTYTFLDKIFQAKFLIQLK